VIPLNAPRGASFSRHPIFAKQPPIMTNSAIGECTLQQSRERFDIMSGKTPAVSSIADSLFKQAGLQTAQVYRRLDKLIAAGQRPIMRPGHYYCRTVRKQTGVPLRSISRRNCSLLIHVESHNLFWHYTEYDRRKAYLALACTMPTLVADALTGVPVECLIDLPLVAGTRIKEIGGKEVRLDVQWLPLL